MNVVILTFHSTHRAIEAQHLLEQNQVPFRVIPTPTEISADCGIALLLSHEVAGAGKHILTESKVPAHYTSAINKKRGLVITSPFID